MTPKTLKQAFDIACAKPEASESKTKTPPLKVDTYTGTPGEAMMWLKYGTLVILAFLIIPFVAAFYSDSVAEADRVADEWHERDRAKAAADARAAK